MSFKPTDEQQAIVAAMREGENLVITAGAGAGKTSTMKMATELMSGKGVYVAFNKSVQLEAASKFARHVDCRTAHSLAYGAVGKRYRARMAAPVQPAYQLANILDITEGIRFDKNVQLHPNQVARLARDTVSRFCATTDSEIKPWHVARQVGISENEEWHRDLQKLVLPFAQKAWQNLQADDEEGRFNPEDKAGYANWVRFTHSHYLKLWAMTKPRVNADFIVFDEAQDADPLMAAVVQDQKHAQLIAVGDENQAIYGWRGAVDALAKWPADQRLQLTESFRFGPEIAEEANKWLELLDADIRITGRGGPGRVGPIKGWPDAVLCRTNGEGMAQAMLALQARKRVAISGGGDPIKNMAEAARQLKEKGSTSHPELCAFTSWQQVQDYVEHEKAVAGDLKTMVRLIDKYTPDGVIEAVKQLTPEKKPKWAKNWSPPDVLVSTMHKAKGGEWGRVVIGPDSYEPQDADGEPASVSKADAMLWYVAVTRAQDELDRAPLKWIDGRIARGDRVKKPLVV